MTSTKFTTATLLAALAALVFHGTAGAQFTTLAASTLRPGEPFGVIVTNTWGNVPVFIGVDTRSATTVIRTNGATLGLALSQNFFLLGGTGYMLDATGTLLRSYTMASGARLEGLILYAQAVSMDPLGRPTVSNLLTAPVHPPIAVGGRTLGLALGDDATTDFVFSFMTFPFFGTGYTSVRVDSNGNLSFGGSLQSDASETVTELLTEAPRVAMLWDDLDPSASAAANVMVVEDATHLTVVFSHIPQFGFSDVNTFACTLYATGDVSLYFDTVATQDGIVGIAAGSNPGAVAPVNFSALATSFCGPGAAIYEVFNAQNPFDLAHTEISFIALSNGGYQMVR
jgi:hypothetical protein